MKGEKIMDIWESIEQLTDKINDVIFQKILLRKKQKSIKKEFIIQLKK